jgi:trimethylamine-N-oxide reductase (cytochrome c)
MAARRNVVGEENKEYRYTNCTSAGPVFIYVKNGRIIRAQPMHFEETEVKPWTISVNGKTYTPPSKYPLLYWGHAVRNWVYSPNRVCHPLKRVDWDPEGERHPENRGKSGYVKISWDEALDILTSEINRVREVYGPSAILAGHSPHPSWGSLHYFYSDFFRFWNILGCTMHSSTPLSWEGWVSGAAFMYEHIAKMGILPSPDSLQDISENSEQIVLWSTDPITHNHNRGIDTPRPFIFWKELGKKVILIDPFYNDTGATHADKWLPIIPGTDAAMAAAIAYVWITEGTYDKEYLDTHTIGFDEDHLPPQAPTGTSFKNYILGKADGIPKTPKWSEQITGIPARTVKALAREWASMPTALFAMFGGACRRAYAHEWTRFMVTLQAMQGIGKPGVCLIGGCLNLCGPYDNRQIGPPGFADGGMNYVAKNRYTNSVEQSLPDIILDRCILDPPVKWQGGRLMTPDLDAYFAKYEYPMKHCYEIHMMLLRGSSSYSGPDYNRDIRVYQSPQIETVVTQNPWFDRDCKFADIVLPVTTNFERNDITEPGKTGVYVPPALINLRCAIFHQQCVEPVGESKTDLEIYTELAERLGIKDKFTEGNSEEDWLKKIYAKTEIPMSYEEFKKKGYYVWPFLDDYEPCKQLEPFYMNPEKNPLKTPSGKIEIFSQKLFEEYGADNPEIPPVPHYIPEWEGRFTKPLIDKYPLQLLTRHPKFRFHGKFNDVTWLREIYKVRGQDEYEYEPIYMNPIDADNRGLKNGDIVRVFNDRGQILCGVMTSQRILNGVVWVAYGSWWDLLEPVPGAIDRGGESNFLTPSKGMSEHYIGAACNSALVEVEKADLEELSKKYPEGWAGKYSSWKKD